MQVTETVNQGLKRELKIVIPAADLAKKTQARLAEMAGRAQIKGFRPGKVPVDHLKRLYGKSIMGEIVQAQIDEGTPKILEERKLRAAYRPEVKLPEDTEEVDRIFDGKADFAYTLSFEVIPEFELKDLTSIALTRHVADVSDEDIKNALERISTQVRSFSPKDGSAEEGDQLIISFVGSVNGTPFEGGTATDAPLVIGSGQFIPGFEEQLKGAKAGDKRTVSVTFPADYGVKDLAGKAAEFSVTVTRVEAAEAVAFDDEFAKKIGFDTLEALKTDIRSRLSGEYGRVSSMKMKRDVLDALDAQYTFELPQKLLDDEFNAIWSALVREMAKTNRTFADENTTEDEAKAEYRRIAERRVRLGLVLGTLGERESIKVADEELQRALFDRARQFPGEERQVIDYYRKNPPALVELRGPLYEQKVVDYIVGQAAVTEKKISREELQALMSELDDEIPTSHDHDDHEGHDHAGHDHEGHDHNHRHEGHDHSGHDHGKKA